MGRPSPAVEAVSCQQKLWDGQHLPSQMRYILPLYCNVLGVVTNGYKKCSCHSNTMAFFYNFFVGGPVIIFIMQNDVYMMLEGGEVT